MHHKTQSLITVSILLGFMIVVAVLMNNIEANVTGLAVKPICECSSDSECDDGNPATGDICLYPEDCVASLCINK